MIGWFFIYYLFALGTGGHNCMKESYGSRVDFISDGFLYKCDHISSTHRLSGSSPPHCYLYISVLFRKSVGN